MTYLLFIQCLMDTHNEYYAFENKRIGMFEYLVWLNYKFNGKLKTYLEYQEIKIATNLLRSM